MLKWPKYCPITDRCNAVIPSSICKDTSGLVSTDWSGAVVVEFVFEGEWKHTSTTVDRLNQDLTEQNRA